MTKKIYFFLFLLSTTLLLQNSCNKRTEGTNFPDEVKLTTTVYDKESGQKISGATLGLYSNYDAYLAALSNSNTAGADFYLTSNGSGMATFDKVNPTTDYWLLVTYKDPSKALFYSNENLSSQLDKFVKSSEVKLNVEVEPVGANVSFYTLNGLSNIPITVVFNNVTNKIIDTVGSTNFQAFYSKVATFSVKEGTYTYKATSKNGCEWTGIIDVKNGQHIKQQLELCQRGSIIFILNSSNVGTVNTRFPLNIYIDGNPTPVGSIQNTPMTSTTSCLPSTAGSYYTEIFLDAGSASTPPHSYVVKSAASGGLAPCVWTGQITGPINVGCNPTKEVKLTGDCP